jgi:hypothetical protein
VIAQRDSFVNAAHSRLHATMVERDLVQVLLPSRALRASFIGTDATVRELIATLLAEDGPDIVRDVVHFQDFEPNGTECNPSLWAIQRVILSDPNRSWSDEELDGLGNGRPFFRIAFLGYLSCMVYAGILSLDSYVADILSARSESAPILPQRQSSSDFQLTSHLHVPQLRLVYLSSCIEITTSFVPDMPRGFKCVDPWYQCFQVLSVPHEGTLGS